MRWLFWVLLILSLATGVALVAGHNHGYVLIVRAPYRLELSLNLLLVLIVLSFAVLHLGLQLIHYTRRLPASIRSYKEAQRVKNGHAALIGSLHAMVEGHYTQAEEAASRALLLGEDAGLSALIAARASHKLKHKDRRDQYLNEAERRAPQAAIARLLLQAEMLLDDRDYDKADRVLQALDKIEPHHPQAQQLSLKVQMRLHHWEQVLIIVKWLEEHNMLESWQYLEYRQQAYQYLMQRYAGDASALAAYWKKMPEGDRLDVRIAHLAALAFLDAGDGNQATQIVEASLKQNWDSKLAGLLGNNASTDAQQQLRQTELWLPNHKDDAQLLLSLGNICARLSQWDRARNYLEASISIKPSAAAYLAMAKLLDSHGNSEAANDHYRRSAELNATQM
jgi:HemY protein